MEEIINKVEQSGIIQLSPEDYLPSASEWVCLSFDSLFLDAAFPIVREKEVREKLKTLVWEDHLDTARYAGIKFNSDTIYPQWLPMLLASHFSGLSVVPVFGYDSDEIRAKIALKKLHDEPLDTYTDARIIIKGCSSVDIPDFLPQFVQKYQGVVKSLLFGEACSTVPIYKRKKSPQ